MKVSWIHSFPAESVSSGVFMFELAEAVRAEGVSLSLIEIRPRQIINLFRLPADVRKRVAECDVVHVQYGSGCGLAAARLPGSKIITLRGSDWYGCPADSFSSHFRRALSIFCTRASIGSYQKVITVSDRMKQEVHAWRPDIRLLSIPSGIDLRIFRQMDRLDARRRLGHPNDEAPWVLFSTVQSNNPVKRENLARQAFELLRRQLPSARFQLLTGRPHSEVPLLVNASNVILLTSTHEGWPNIIKEGLACNVPFVSTNVSDLSRIAAVETSCRVVKDDASVLASSLLDVIQRPRPTGLRRFVEPMEMGKVARQLVGVYREVLGENIKSYGLKKS